MSVYVTAVSGSVFIDGAYVTERAQIESVGGLSSVRSDLHTAGLFPGDRIVRADRVTQLGAMVAARATAHLPTVPPEEFSVVTASVWATAHTNERFERRRREGRAPEPRVFPYTAPNAAGGEFAIALHARGPSMALVGGSDVALQALERAQRWILRGEIRRALVLAIECPPPSAGELMPDVDAIECAAALVIERRDLPSPQSLRARYVSDEIVAPQSLNRRGLLSVGPLSEVWFAARDGLTHERITVPGAVGAAIEVSIGSLA